MSTRRLDCRNLRCPMPIVQLAMATRELGANETIAVEATDAAFLTDVRAWAKLTGHVVEQEVDGAVKQVVVRKGNQP